MGAHHEGLGKVPVVQGHVGLNPRSQKGVNEVAVKLQTLRVWQASTLRKDARPGDGEPEILNAQRLHQLYILLSAGTQFNTGF